MPVDPKKAQYVLVESGGLQRAKDERLTQFQAEVSKLIGSGYVPLGPPFTFESQLMQALYRADSWRE